MRSCLLLPPGADHAEALSSGADALVVDVSQVTLPAVRALLDAAKGEQSRPCLYVNLPVLDDPGFSATLAALARTPPDGVVLKADCGGDVQRLGARLACFEAEAGVDDGATRILANISTPQSALALASFARCSARLTALAFDRERLAAALGVGENAAPIRAARALLPLAATAAGVPALDAPCPDPAHLGAECANARHDGFSGKMARRIDDLAAIRAAFAGVRAEKSPQSPRQVPA
jgi:citrate lyase subunit beta/citryl-CoA lyase